MAVNVSVRAPDVRVTPTVYTVVPEVIADHREARHWTIIVELRGGDRWAVCHGGACLSDRGRWDDEPQPSARTERWLDRHRFSLDDALEKAAEQAVKVRTNGVSAAEFAGRGERERRRI